MGLATNDTSLALDYLRGGRYRDRESWRYLHREVHGEASTGLFTGEGAVERFLDATLPARCHGGPDHGPECLCDVDVTKTEGMVWDNPPPIMRGIHDVDSLVQAAASIWLNLDVNPPTRDHMMFLDLEPEDQAYVTKRIREGAWRRELEEEGYPLHETVYGMIRRLYDVQHPVAIVDYRRAVELHDEGCNVAEIFERMNAEGAQLTRPHNVANALKRMGIVPRYPPRRPPQSTTREQEAKLPSE